MGLTAEGQFTAGKRELLATQAQLATGANLFLTANRRPAAAMRLRFTA
jgi:hypothetical protein